MPTRPMHPCTHRPRCPTLVPAGQSKCRAHQLQDQKAYNQTQRPARHAFYQTKEWRALSNQVLREEPICSCGRRTTQADHIISVRERPALALERGNVTGRCGPCHSRKTAKEDGRWGSAESRGR